MHSARAEKAADAAAADAAAATEAVAEVEAEMAGAVAVVAAVDAKVAKASEADAQLGRAAEAVANAHLCDLIDRVCAVATPYTRAVLPKSEAELGAIFAAFADKPLFAKLAHEQLVQVASNMAKATFKKGDALMREGEHGDTFFILQAGTCAVTMLHGGTGRDLKVGDGFGEIALIYNQPQTATVTATSDCEVFLMNQAAWPGDSSVREDETQIETAPAEERGGESAAELGETPPQLPGPGGEAEAVGWALVPTMSKDAAEEELRAAVEAHSVAAAEEAAAMATKVRLSSRVGWHFLIASH